jgi:hypothetical protein
LIAIVLKPATSRSGPDFQYSLVPVDVLKELGDEEKKTGYNIVHIERWNSFGIRTWDCLQ